RGLEGSGFGAELWTELEELGVFGLRAAGAAGAASAEDGARSGLAEAGLVFEELGRCLAPGPLVFSHLAASLLPAAGNAGRVVTGLDLAGDGAASSSFLLEHLAAADAVLLLRPDGVYQVAPRAIDARAIEAPLDPFTPLHRAMSLPTGECIAGGAAAARMRLEGTVLTSALLLGIAEATLSLATRHAGERRQFDRPIGSFQAIKHLLADCYVRQELARASVYAAGVLLDESGDAADSEALRAVAAGKLIAGEAAMKNSRTCIQVLGGMGFTWESPAHYYLKRTWVLEQAFGTSARQAESLADGVGQA
ncbi:acyl-CoA dehydrogenase, partial [Myxococcota bacterium]|nr:acyl-CoA dehydrogenase [Myxococcota bacterium]